MSVLDKVRIVIYRFHEKGLEIFLVNTDLQNIPSVWKIPKGQLSSNNLNQEILDMIELNPYTDDQGHSVTTYAIEGDWHDIPSIKGLLKHDVKIVKDTIKEMVPGIEQGTYFALKEAFKKVMPQEYKVLKELKDVLFDRNIVKYF